MFILLINLINWLPISGQDVTTFMDIPVDGNENVMIQKLEEKGFKPIPIDNSIKNLDCILNMDKELSGVYNQDSVIVTIVTDKCERKVTRIIVTDMESVSASHIKSRFNNLITQFHRNKSYVSANDIRNCYISENEDLIRKINLKDYFAAFYQTPKQKSSTDPSSSIEKTKKKEEFWRIYSQIPRCQDFKYILELKESFGET